MTDAKPETAEAIEADDMGERPDLGRTPDALADALTGSGVGSDTRAGSLQGGAATGSDDDPDQAAVDRIMADQGRASAHPESPSEVDPNGIANTGAKGLRTCLDALAARFRPGSTFAAGADTVRVRADSGPFTGPISQRQGGFALAVLTIPWRVYRVNTIAA